MYEFCLSHWTNLHFFSSRSWISDRLLPSSSCRSLLWSHEVRFPLWRPRDLGKESHTDMQNCSDATQIYMSIWLHYKNSDTVDSFDMRTKDRDYGSFHLGHDVGRCAINCRKTKVSNVCLLADGRMRSSEVGARSTALGGKRWVTVDGWQMKGCDRAKLICDQPFWGKRVSDGWRRVEEGGDRKKVRAGGSAGGKSRVTQWCKPISGGCAMKCLGKQISDGRNRRIGCEQ